MLDCDRKLECLIAALSNGGTKPVGKLLKRRVKTKDRSFLRLPTDGLPTSPMSGLHRTFL